MEGYFLLVRTRWDRIARVPGKFLAESGDYIPEWSLPLAGWPMISLLNSSQEWSALDYQWSDGDLESNS